MDSLVKTLAEDGQIYRVGGFSCANCTGKLEKNIKQLTGVQDAGVSFGASRIDVHGNASVQELEKADAFEDLKVSPEKLANSSIQAIKEDTKVPKEEEIPFCKKRSTLLFTTLLITFDYLSHFANREDNFVTSMLFIGSIVIGGYSLFKVGFQNLICSNFDIKTLMTVTVVGAAIIGEWAGVFIAVVLFVTSEALERLSMDRARQSIRSLMDITPEETLVMRNGQEVMIHVDDIAVDDIAIVKPGEKIAMDGTIINGVSVVDQVVVTGELIPVAKAVDDEVFAGTFSEEGLLEVKTTKYAEDATIPKIIHPAEEVQGEHAPARTFVNEFTKYYTPIIVVIVALVTVVSPLSFSGSWGTWVYQGLAASVVGCPCTLVISAPISIVSAIKDVAKKSVLTKDGIYLKELGVIRAIVLGKIGTLTKGVPVVTDFRVLSDQVEEKELFSIITALEYRSQRPLASAVMKKAGQDNTTYSNVRAEDFTSVTGWDTQENIDGTIYCTGSPRLFKESDVSDFSPESESKVRILQN